MVARRSAPKPKAIVGWREWVALTELGGAVVKAKVDTGARTSAIHAYRISTYESDGLTIARFQIHPVQKRKRPVLAVEAPVVDIRHVRSSNGSVEERLGVRTPIEMGQHRFSIDLTLTNRDEMGFRMLLGRSALKRRFLVDPGRSYVTGRPAEDSETAAGS